MQARIWDAPGQLLASAGRDDRIPGPNQDERRAPDRLEPWPRVEVERYLALGAIAWQVRRRAPEIGTRHLPGAGYAERTRQTQGPPEAKNALGTTVSQHAQEGEP